MSDPRNVAHDKKVKQEKEHQPEKAGTDSKPRKRQAEAKESEVAETTPAPPADLAKSQAVLSKLKEMEFHSRANIETLAGLTLEIEEELKQKEFSGPIGALYSAQDQFQTKILALIESYESHVGTMKE